MVGAFNSAMNGLFQVLAWPLSWAPRMSLLLAVSAVSGVLLLLVFKYTSPQKTIGTVKQRIFASIYEIFLYKDEIGTLTRAIGRLFRDNAVYLSCCLVALVPAVVVCLPLLFQMDARYGFAPLEPGRSYTLAITLAEGVDPVTDALELELPDGVELEAGPVRVRSTREAIYRIRVERPGQYEIAVRVNGERITKRVDALPGVATVSPARFKETHVLDALMYPAERPLAKTAPIEAIRLPNPRADMLGMDGDSFPWAIVFFVVSVVVAFAFKGVFKVNI